MDKQITQKMVDDWVKQNNEHRSDRLFDEKLPGYKKKLDKLDRQIVKLLNEIKEIFPDAQYYTASGGFNLMLGHTHDNTRDAFPLQHRIAWSGTASIGDGDF